ncbi:uncharacterized protein TEOVI_000273100 [Trypanosoma equiperdum]|uniref:Uncharacterized protein n=2 Tax=Trypanozoon TaxID=39700 RepID=Q384L5_TRYB2|nr:hypothetical protein, conserved [Trypanosoma brucei brucei TREU927]EAN79766.1 hypothetical protein, conserved [Trypanosoma brucei brucei TREU927]SCU71151.1 hypothetical protein, conserved [Trypanosoma equiperdum]
MLNPTFSLYRKTLQSYPVPPKIRHYDRRWSGSRTNPYNRQYWRVIMNENYSRPSFWVSDFRHRYLMRTGTDYQGQVPSSPQPGLYQGFSDVHKLLANHPKPQRESRHLPVLPMTPRVVFEHANEKRIDTAKKMRRDRRRIEELKTLEFWGWYMKLQRVRGRWCREQGVSSRGVYGPAVDAAELWG